MTHGLRLSRTGLVALRLVTAAVLASEAVDALCCGSAAVWRAAWSGAAFGLLGTGPPSVAVVQAAAAGVLVLSLWLASGAWARGAVACCLVAAASAHAAAPLARHAGDAALWQSLLLLGVTVDLGPARRTRRDGTATVLLAAALAGLPFVVAAASKACSQAWMDGSAIRKVSKLESYATPWSHTIEGALTGWGLLPAAAVALAVVAYQAVVGATLMAATTVETYGGGGALWWVRRMRTAAICGGLAFHASAALMLRLGWMPLVFSAMLLPLLPNSAPNGSNSSCRTKWRDTNSFVSGALLFLVVVSAASSVASVRITRHRSRIAAAMATVDDVAWAVGVQQQWDMFSRGMAEEESFVVLSHETDGIRALCGALCREPPRPFDCPMLQAQRGAWSPCSRRWLAVQTHLTWAVESSRRPTGSDTVDTTTTYEQLQPCKCPVNATVSAAPRAAISTDGGGDVAAARILHASLAASPGMTLWYLSRSISTGSWALRAVS